MFSRAFLWLQRKKRRFPSKSRRRLVPFKKDIEKAGFFSPAFSFLKHQHSLLNSW
jgi:hypothetical protein